MAFLRRNEMKTVEQLKVSWESSPRDNPWDELGLEEIVAFAQEDAFHAFADSLCKRSNLEAKPRAEHSAPLKEKRNEP
jgi:hypothetical protein